MASPDFTITGAKDSQDLADIVKLFKAYRDSLDVDLTAQHFTEELVTLPGEYSPPPGTLLLARNTTSGSPLGCVALRPFAMPGYCEMKRLYVSPSARGTGLGKALVHAVIREAKGLGYRTVRLDTLPSMEAARRMYEGLGFVVIEPYYPSPFEGTIYLELVLDGEG